MPNILYTDGSCQPNPGKGGWAFILLKDGLKVIHQGYEPDTTNNRMELFAVLQGLRYFKDIQKDNQLIIRSDSQYLLNGISSWCKKWKHNNWIKSDGKPVLNVDLWEKIYQITKETKITCEHVKGHGSVLRNTTRFCNFTEMLTI